MQNQSSLFWRKIQYYAPFLSTANINQVADVLQIYSDEESFCDKIDTFHDIECNEINFDSSESFANPLFGHTSFSCFHNVSSPSPEELEEQRSIQRTTILLKDLERTIAELQLSGIPLSIIHEFIDKHQTLSRMVITQDYRIYLPEYNNMEIEMTALPKALFFLFLRYPEGIVLKELQDHYTELLNIYRQLRPGEPESKITLSVTKIVNPLSNSIHENLARIRRAFVGKFDEHLSKNYIITGRASEAYSIPLDRNLVVWED